MEQRKEGEEAFDGTIYQVAIRKNNESPNEEGAVADLQEIIADDLKDSPRDDPLVHPQSSFSSSIPFMINASTTIGNFQEEKEAYQRKIEVLESLCAQSNRQRECVDEIVKIIEAMYAIKAFESKYPLHVIKLSDKADKVTGRFRFSSCPSSDELNAYREVMKRLEETCARWRNHTTKKRPRYTQKIADLMAARLVFAQKYSHLGAKLSDKAWKVIQSMQSASSLSSVESKPKSVTRKTEDPNEFKPASLPERPWSVVEQPTDHRISSSSVAPRLELKQANDSQLDFKMYEMQTATLEELCALKFIDERAQKEVNELSGLRLDYETKHPDRIPIELSVNAKQIIQRLNRAPSDASRIAAEVHTVSTTKSGCQIEVDETTQPIQPPRKSQSSKSSASQRLVKQTTPEEQSDTKDLGEIANATTQHVIQCVDEPLQDGVTGKRVKVDNMALPADQTQCLNLETLCTQAQGKRDVSPSVLTRMNELAQERFVVGREKVLLNESAKEVLRRLNTVLPKDEAAPPSTRKKGCGRTRAQRRRSRKRRQSRRRRLSKSPKYLTRKEKKMRLLEKKSSGASDDSCHNNVTHGEEPIAKKSRPSSQDHDVINDESPKEEPEGKTVERYRSIKVKLNTAHGKSKDSHDRFVWKEFKGLIQRYVRSMDILTLHMLMLGNFDMDRRLDSQDPAVLKPISDSKTVREYFRLLVQAVILESLDEINCKKAASFKKKDPFMFESVVTLRAQEPVLRERTGEAFEFDHWDETNYFFNRLDVRGLSRICEMRAKELATNMLNHIRVNLIPRIRSLFQLRLGRQMPGAGTKKRKRIVGKMLYATYNEEARAKLDEIPRGIVMELLQHLEVDGGYLNPYAVRNTKWLGNIVVYLRTLRFIQGAMDQYLKESREANDRSLARGVKTFSLGVLPATGAPSHFPIAREALALLCQGLSKESREKLLHRVKQVAHERHVASRITVEQAMLPSQNDIDERDVYEKLVLEVDKELTRSDKTFNVDFFASRGCEKESKETKTKVVDFYRTVLWDVLFAKGVHKHKDVTKYRFAHSITTDGCSVSLKYVKMVKVKKSDGDEEDSEGAPVSEKEAAVLLKDPCNLNSPYGIDRTKPFSHVVLVDMGKASNCSLMHRCGEDVLSSRKVRKHRIRFYSTRRHRQNAKISEFTQVERQWREMFKYYSGLLDAFKALGKTLRTSNRETFLNTVAFRLKHAALWLDFRMARSFRNWRFKRHRFGKASLFNQAKVLTFGLRGKDKLVCIGDWSKQFGIKNGVYAPILKLRAVIEQLDVTVVLVDESNTSKKCFRCGTVLDHCTYQDKEKGAPSEAWRAEHCLHCGVQVQRDCNAVLNMKRIVLDHLDGKPRPAYLKRGGLKKPFKRGDKVRVAVRLNRLWARWSSAGRVTNVNGHVYTVELEDGQVWVRHILFLCGIQTAYEGQEVDVGELMNHPMSSNRVYGKVQTIALKNDRWEALFVPHGFDVEDAAWFPFREVVSRYRKAFYEFAKDASVPDDIRAMIIHHCAPKERTCPPPIFKSNDLVLVAMRLKDDRLRARWEKARVVDVDEYVYSVDFGDGLVLMRHVVFLSALHEARPGDDVNVSVLFQHPLVSCRVNGTVCKIEVDKGQALMIPRGFDEDDAFWMPLSLAIPFVPHRFDQLLKDPNLRFDIFMLISERHNVKKTRHSSGEDDDDSSSCSDDSVHVNVSEETSVTKTTRRRTNVKETLVKETTRRRRTSVEGTTAKKTKMMSKAAPPSESPSIVQQQLPVYKVGDLVLVARRDSVDQTKAFWSSPARVTAVIETAEHVYTVRFEGDGKSVMRHATFLAMHDKTHEGEKVLIDELMKQPISFLRTYSAVTEIAEREGSGWSALLCPIGFDRDDATWFPVGEADTKLGKGVLEAFLKSGGDATMTEKVLQCIAQYAAKAKPKPSGKSRSKGPSLEQPLVQGTRRKGFKNPDTFCYANAVVQALVSCQTLKAKLKETSPLESKAFQGIWTCFTAADNGESVSVNHLIRPYVDKKFAAVGVQQDAHEFLNKLLEISTRNYEVFENMLEKTIKCVNCLRVSQSQGPFRIHSLDFMDDKTDLKDLLTLNMHEEPKEATCEDCGSRDTLQIDWRFKRLSLVLVLHLKRFIVKKHGGIQKRNDKVLVPRLLSLESLCASELDHSPDVTSTDYELVAMVNHDGPSMREGHYTTLARDTMQQEERWFDFNDSQVTPVGSDWTNYGNTEKGYIFLYENRNQL